MEEIYLKILEDRSTLFILKEDPLWDEILIKISSEEYMRIINTKGEYRILKDGTLGHYIKPLNENFMVNAEFNYEKEEYIEVATQEEFLQAKNNIEREMSEMYRDIKAREELSLSINDQNLKMLELRNKLDYINSKILVKK